MTGHNWITPEIFKETREVLQPFYAETLTDEQVLEILINVENLFRVLRESAINQRQKAEQGRYEIKS